MKQAWQLARKTFSEWSAAKAPRLGAALAYYTALSIAPLLLVVIGIAGLALGDEAARGQIMGQMQGLIGAEGARAVEDVLQNSRDTESGTIATLVGLAMLLLSAGGVFAQLKDALDTVWGVEPKHSGGWIAMIRERFLSMAMVLGVGFLLLVSLVISAGVAAAGDVLAGLGPAGEALAQLVVAVVSLIVITVLFAMIFKILPDAEVSWSDVWVGAFVTALLFVVGKIAIGLYLGHASIGSTYGAAGSFVVLLVWVYYSAQIVLLGAEFTQVWAREYGSRIAPSAGAVRSPRPAQA
jgi:membrane protein